MSLAAKYATLAAIHDEVCERASSIDPWVASAHDFKCLKESISYTALRDGVAKLTDEDQPRIESMLEDVARDCAAGAAGTSRGRRRGRPSDTDPKNDMRIADAWHTGHHKTYADLERDLGLQPGDVKRAVDRHRHRHQRRK